MKSFHSNIDLYIAPFERVLSKQIGQKLLAISFVFFLIIKSIFENLNFEKSLKQAGTEPGQAQQTGTEQGYLVGC